MAITFHNKIKKLLFEVIQKVDGDLFRNSSDSEMLFYHVSTIINCRPLRVAVLLNEPPYTGVIFCEA